MASAAEDVVGLVMRGVYDRGAGKTMEHGEEDDGGDYKELFHIWPRSVFGALRQSFHGAT